MAWGERFKEIEEAQREKANTLSSAKLFRQGVLGSEKRVGVSMDGTMAYILDEGWKELEVGCCFEIEVFPTWKKERREWQALAHAVNNQYVAHLGGPELFGQMLWAQAQGQGWERAKDKQMVGDGASWVWNVAQDHFYDARQVVDWHHAMEHLPAIAALLYGESTPAAKRWYRPAQTALYQGHAGRIALQLNQAARGYPEDVADELRRQAGYLHRHQRRMQYMEMCEDEYVIGSGTSP